MLSQHEYTNTTCKHTDIEQSSFIELSNLKKLWKKKKGFSGTEKKPENNSGGEMPRTKLFKAKKPKMPPKKKKKKKKSGSTIRKIKYYR